MLYEYYFKYVPEFHDDHLVVPYVRKDLVSFVPQERGYTFWQAEIVIETLTSYEEKFFIVDHIATHFHLIKVVDHVVRNCSTGRLFIREVSRTLKPVNFILKFDHDFREFIMIDGEAEAKALIVRPSFDVINAYAVFAESFSFSKAKFKDLKILFEKLLNQKLLLESINMDRGFVLSDNIFNREEYPIIYEYAEQLLDKDLWNKSIAETKVKLYRWILQIILLQMYTDCNLSLNRINDFTNLKYAEQDLVMDLKSCFKVLKNWINSHLDTSIKLHFRQRKPYIKSDIFAGFDTEYVPLDYGRNELVSAQLSLSGCLKLFIPLKTEFNFEGVNTFTAEIYMRTPPSFRSRLESVKLNINNLIELNTDILFGSHYTKMNNICQYFIENNDKIDFIKAESNGYSFQFKKVPIINKFILPAPGETLKIKFDTLIKLINDSIKVDKAELENLIEDESCGYIKHFEKFEKTSVSWNKETLLQNPAETIILSNKDNNIKHKNIKNDSNIYLCAHYNAADLSMLDDWLEVSRQNIDLLKKSYCSLVTPMESLGMKVFVRDTLLLSSAAASTLQKVGKAHGLTKVPLDSKWFHCMDKLLKHNPDLFKSYAMQDSLITLIHALFMNDFSFSMGLFKLPCTLGSLTSKFAKNKWAEDDYKGYQVNPEYPLGNVQETFNPKGIRSTGDIGENLSLFIGSFRGGRNECFAYGIDKDTRWYDYDLTSCYATIMSMCGNPDYAAGTENVKEGGELPLERASDFDFDSSGVSTPAPGEDLTEEESDIEQLSALTPDISTLCGNPAYDKATNLNNYNASKIDFTQSYAALRVKFKFPASIKYPPIPVALDKNITIYPLEGETLISGLEYLSAKNILRQELYRMSTTKYIKIEDLNKTYFINVIYGYNIPFEKHKDELVNKPFFEIINVLQSNRRLHKKLSGKGSAMERIYKDLGNMLYGKVVCGISNKRNYDSRLLQMTTISGNFLTNPIIGTWITGFVRALIAELLNATHILGGKVIACTTDGFVTNIPDLENEILNYHESIGFKNSFLKQYRDIRNKLSGDPAALEVKTNVRGLIQWTTRGQLSINHTDPALQNFNVEIAAMTGFQKYQFNHKDLVNMVSKTLRKGNKIFFLQKRLTGSVDNYKENKDVSMLASVRKFRTVFDTKRNVISSNNTLLDTAPYKNVKQALINRTLMNAMRQGIYSHKYSHSILYANSSDILFETIRFFVRMWCEHHNFIMNENDKLFLIDFIKSNVKIFKKEYSSERLIDIINTTLQDPGSFVSKLPIYNKNLRLVARLYNDCWEWMPEIMNLFRHHFSNFLPFLDVPQKISTSLALISLENEKENKRQFERSLLQYYKNIDKLSDENLNIIKSLLMKL